MRYYIFLINLFIAVAAFGQDELTTSITPASSFFAVTNKTSLSATLPKPQFIWEVDTTSDVPISTLPSTSLVAINNDSLHSYFSLGYYFAKIDNKPVNVNFYIPNAQKTLDAGEAVNDLPFTNRETMKAPEKKAPQGVDLSEYKFDDTKQLSRPTATSYINYPINPNGHFEIRQDELKTMNGTTVALSTTTVSAMVWNDKSTTLSNGAEITVRHIADEKLIGSGRTAWLLETAPTAVKEVSVDLNTFANFQSSHNSGAFNINTTGGTLQLATVDKSDGKVGWEFPNANTTLELSASRVYTRGDFITNGVIISEKSLVIGKLLDDHLTFTPYRISFNDGNYVSSLQDKLIPQSPFESFANNSANPAGILVNASGDFASIRFSLNSSVMGQFVNESMIIGPGFPDPSAVLVIESKNRGVSIPKLSDEQIFGIKSPSEGLEVYSLNHHCFAYYDGEDWRLIAYSIKLERPSKNAIAKVEVTNEL